MRASIWVLFGIFLVGLFCASANAQAPLPTFLFLLENNGSATGAIHAFSVNVSAGALSEAPGSPYSAGFGPQQLAVDPTGRFLYVTNQTSQDITGYSVDPATGALTALAGSPFFIGGDPVVMGLDPTGRFLYVFAGTTTVNGVSQESLFEYLIDGVSGTLTAANASPMIWEFGPGDLVTSIGFSPAGNLVYLGQTPSGANSGAIQICSVDFTTGNLTLIGSAKPTSTESDHVSLSPGGNFLYSTSRPNQAADVFTAGTGGQLTEISGSPYPVGNAPAAILVHPSGNFMYVVNENQPYQTNLNPIQYTGSISAFGVNGTTGALTPIPGSPFAAGINASSIGADPSGKFAYVVSTAYTPNTYTGFPQIQAFSIDPTTGTLTPFPTAAWTDPVQGIGTQLAVSSGASGTPNPAPSISSLSPASVPAGGAQFTLQVNGTGFVQTSKAYFAGQPRNTTFVSSTQLNVSILASDITNGGTAVVFVFNLPPGGGASSSVPFAITSSVPVITALSPTTIIAGSSSLNITITGSNFLTSSIVNFDGVAVPTIYMSPRIIRDEVPPVFYVTPGIGTITVTNPPNGSFPGGTSNALTIPIVAAPPKFAVTAISPTSAQAGGPAFTLTVTGTGFVSGAQVSFNLANELTTFVSSTQLTAAIPASAIAVAANPYVIVTNPDGTQSSPLTFAINNPAPGGSSVTPPSLPAGASALTLNVAGTGFIPPDSNGVSGSTVDVNGTPRPTKFVSSTLLQVTLLATDLSQGGTLNITVVNPPPGGGASPALGFVIADFSVTAENSAFKVTAGTPANFSLLLTPSGSFSAPVSLAVSSQTPLPAGASPSFTPSAPLIPGASKTSVTLTIATEPHSTTWAVRLRRPLWPALPVLCLTGLLMWTTWVWLRSSGDRTRQLVPGILLVVTLIVAGGLASCGGLVSGTAPNAPAPQPTPTPNPATGTPAGTYPITVTATSGTVSHTATVTLTVM